MRDSFVLTKKKFKLKIKKKNKVKSIPIFSIMQKSNNF